MSYEPSTKSGSGLFFGGYHSTTQAIPEATPNTWVSSNIEFPFDQIYGNASWDNSEIKLKTNTKAYVVGDINTSNLSGQSRFPIFSLGFTNSRYQNTTFHNRNEFSHGVDCTDAFIVGSTKMKMHAYYQVHTTRNSPSNDFIAGFYV